jgi:hypothetical protein
MKLGLALTSGVIAGIINAILSFVLTKPVQIVLVLGKAFLMGAIITAFSVWLAQTIFHK